ncbi:glycosyltransferase family 4 protein [Haloarcula sp. AONF1]
MKIGLDARTLIGDRTGVGNYLKNILEAGGFDGHRVLLYYQPQSDTSPPSLNLPEQTTIQWQPVKLPPVTAPLPYGLRVIWWMNVSLPRALKTDTVDCFFSPNFVQPQCYSGTSVAVVHDLAHIKAADTHTTAYRWYLHMFLTATINRADHIVVVSQHTKQDVLDYYNISPEKVSVCYGAADDRFQPRTVSEDVHSELVDRYGLASEFALFVGSVEPRKNVHKVIEALERMDPVARPQLVVVGSRDSSYDALTRAIDRYDGEVVFTGYVPDDHLPLLYNLASAFVYLSKYEGFGLPVVEAMQSGTPVLVSNQSCLPEVIEGAGITVDPADPDAVASGFTELLNERAGEQYADKGIQRARDFSWSESAKQINAIFNRVR